MNRKYLEVAFWIATVLILLGIAYLLWELGDPSSLYNIPGPP